MGVIQQDVYVEGNLGTNFTVDALNTRIFEDTGTANIIKIEIKGIKNGEADQEYIKDYNDLIDIPLKIRKKFDTGANENLFIDINEFGQIPCVIKPFTGITAVMPEDILKEDDVFTATYNGTHFLLEGANIQTVGNIGLGGFGAPDYAKKGTINLIANSGETWTAEADGYVWLGSKLTMVEDCVWTIDNAIVMNHSSAVGGKTDGVFAVKKGNIVKCVSAIGTTGVFCYFIPTLSSSGGDIDDSELDHVWNEIQNLQNAKMPIAPVGEDLWAGSGDSWYKIPKVQNASLTLTVDVADLQNTIDRLPKIINAAVTINVNEGTTTWSINITGFTGSGSITIKPTVPASIVSIKDIAFFNNSLKIISINDLITTGFTAMEYMGTTFAAIRCNANTSIIQLNNISSINTSANTIGVWCISCSSVDISKCTLTNKTIAIKAEKSNVSCLNCIYAGYMQYAYSSEKGSIINVYPAIPNGVVYLETNGGVILFSDMLGNIINDTITSLKTTYSSEKIESIAGAQGIKIEGLEFAEHLGAADNQWSSVCYGNGLFVAVSDNGSGNRVMTSPDGINWTIRSSAADNQWTSVCYGNGLFVAVSSSGAGNRVMTSPDGIIWTIRSSATDNQWRSVCYGNGLFVAVSYSGAGNRVMTSQDGIIWTIRSSAADNEWRSVCYGNGLFVAVSGSGSGNRVMTSPDGIIWTIRSSAANNQWRSVCYGNGLFVAVSSSGAGIIGTSNRVMTSPDGVHWTIGITPTTNLYTSVCYGNGLFIATATYGATMISKNGIDWIFFKDFKIDLTSICYGNGKFVAVSIESSVNKVITGIYRKNSLVIVNFPEAIENMPFIPTPSSTGTTILQSVNGNLNWEDKIEYSNPNLLINGNFDIWQRGTEQTVDGGIGSDDRWGNMITPNIVRTHKQMTIDQPDIVRGTTFYSQTQITTSGNLAYDQCNKEQRIENVRSIPAGPVTLSFYARADTNKHIGIELAQNFGASGSPIVLAIGAQKIAVTSAWKKYAVTINVPSINNKVIGADNCFTVIFHFSAGSDFNDRTDSLGVQTGTFDLAQVKLEIGDKATPFVPKKLSEEIADCQRYYEKSYDIDMPPGTDVVHGLCPTVNVSGHKNVEGFGILPGQIFKTRKRTVPHVKIYSCKGTENHVCGLDLLDSVQAVTDVGHRSETGFLLLALAPATLVNTTSYQYHWTAEAEL